MNEELIAPCGMNCAICSSYLASKHNTKKQGAKIPYCAGCRPRGKNCAFLKKRCGLLLKGKVRFCYECNDFPCPGLNRIDERYRSRYKMSMIENLEFIKENGIGKLLEREEQKWKCTKCGGVVSCHNGICFDCGLNELLKRDKNLYRWND